MARISLLVTNSRLAPCEVYAFYAGRGQEENWIKDLKRGLKSDRLSCSAFAVRGRGASHPAALCQAGGGER